MQRAVLAGLALAALALPASTAVARPSGGTPVALVTAETENELIAVSVPSGKVLGRVHLPADPQNVASLGGTAVAVSTRAGAVTLIAPSSLRVLKVLRGFGQPHLAAIAPNGKWAYVTDDARGQLVVISLTRRRVVKRLFVGLGAHHLTVSPGGQWLWIALGERAQTIVIVDISRPARARLLRRFDPGFLAHDVAFSPDGKRVWVTSSSERTVAVLDAHSAKQLLSVQVGPPPQHVVFGGPRRAYLTSGYASRIVMVDARSGRLLRIASVPYGSFNLATIFGNVVTSSLIRGTVTTLDSRLRIRSSVRVAPAARAVTGVVWP